MTVLRRDMFRMVQGQDYRFLTLILDDTTSTSAVDSETEQYIALPKSGLRAAFGLGFFVARKPQEMVTASLHAGTAFRPSGGCSVRNESKRRYPARTDFSP
jgi:hypothetical protein